MLQRWTRAFHRMQRKAMSMKGMMMRFAAIIVFGACALLIAVAMFSPMFDVREIRVLRTDARIDVERIQLSLASLFRQHLFFVSEQTVTDLLQEAVPDLKSAEVRKQYPSTIQIRLELDQVIARLQIEDPDQNNHPSAGSGAQAGTGSTENQGSDFLTAEGMYVVYRDSQVQAGSGMLMLRIVDWGVRPTPWKPLVEPEFLQTMRKAEEELGKQFSHRISIRAAYLRAREFHLQTETYALWFDLRSPLEEQLARYGLFLQTVDRKTVRDYVDLRLTDKIVYR